MKEKIVIFDIDDVHNEQGYGLEKDDSQLKYIKQLNKVFRLKATLFVPLNWHNKYPIDKDIDWFNWLKRFQNYGHEIASHGIYHLNPNNPNSVQEFYTLNEEQTDRSLQNIKLTWLKLGVDVKGIRFPGWGETRATEKHVHKYFQYVASHILGEKPIIGFNGIYKMPYNLSIENLYDVGQDIFILHSHIGNDKNTTNLLTYKNYLNVVDFLKYLESKYKVTYMTFSDYHTHLRNKINKS